MNKKILTWSITVALAGFLFGFDTVVISGANGPIKELWNTGPGFHGFLMSAALWGTVIGALFAGFPSQRLGRKKTLFWIGVLYAISAIGSAFAPDPYTFVVMRFIGGLGVGASSVTAPTYISEIASGKNRGKLVATYQFNIVLGIFIAFFSNYLLKGVGGVNDWRWMLGIEAIPAILYTLMILTVPRSPRWLLTVRNNEKEAREVLELSGQENVDQILQEIKTAHEADNSRESIFVPKYRRIVILAFLIAFFNQLSGINFILYYAPEILERSGFAAKESLFSSISIGGINLVFTLLGMYLIDRVGRKVLMYIGSVGYIVSLGMVACGFYCGASSGFLLTFILMFVASHAIGQGAVIWVFISEIFPNKVRAFGQAWGSGTHWVFAAIITLITPLFLDADQGIFGDNPWPIFAFFAGFMVLQLLFTKFLMPETKGVSLEELERRLVGKD